MAYIEAYFKEQDITYTLVENGVKPLQGLMSFEDMEDPTMQHVRGRNVWVEKTMSAMKAIYFIRELSSTLEASTSTIKLIRKSLQDIADQHEVVTLKAVCDFSEHSFTYVPNPHY